MIGFVMLPVSSRDDRSVAETHQCLFRNGQLGIGPAVVVAELDLEDAVGELFNHGSHLAREEPGFG